MAVKVDPVLHKEQHIGYSMAMDAMVLSYRSMDTSTKTVTTCLPPCPARMSARGPRIVDSCTVWAKVQDIVKDHSQLKGHFERRAPGGFIGKWIKGKCDRSKARSSTEQEGGESNFCRWATMTYEHGPSTKQGMGPRVVTGTHVIDTHQV